MSKKKKSPRYVATTGLDYPSKEDGRPIRVEKGEEVIEMNDVSKSYELEAGHIVEMEEEDGTGSRE